jgi:hypothetical protein
MSADSFDVDQLTLQYFSSKSLYNKYLAKKDPDSFEQKHLEYKSWRENKEKIFHVIEEYLEDPDDILPKHTKDIFHRFFTEINQVVEKRKIKEDSSTDLVDSDIPYNEHIQDEEDTLFSRVEDIHVEPKNPIEYWKMQKVFKSNMPK